MPLQPKTYPTLEINFTGFEMVDDPSGPVFKHSDQSIVYKVKNQKDELFALKVFSLAYRSPQIFHQAKKILNYKNRPGLTACQRTVIKPIEHPELVLRYPELRYAALMPWIPGKTWMEVIRNQEELSNDQIWNTAQSLALCLWKMSDAGIAHCQLTADNLLINIQENAAASVEFVDLEGLYAAELEEPEFLEINQPEYCHPSLIEGIWNPNADRVAGAILLSEILTWNNPQVREALLTERSPQNGQTGIREDRFRLMVTSLDKHWGGELGSLFEQAWRSEKIEDCPTFDEWRKELKIEQQFFEAKDNQTVVSKGGGVTADLLKNAGDSFSDKDIEIEETTLSHNAIEVVQRDNGRNLYGQREHKKKQNLKKTTNNYPWLWLLAMFFIFLFVGIITNQGNSFNYVSQRTAIVESKVSATAEVHRTATAMTVKTAQTKKTATLRAQITSTALAKELFISRYKNQLPEEVSDLVGDLVFGPKNGELDHDEWSDQVSVEEIDGVMQNFVFNSKFTNPYNAAKKGWSYGLFFRITESGKHYRFYVTSTGTWQLDYYNKETRNVTKIQDGWIPHGIFNQLEDEINILTLLVRNDEGKFYINGDYVDEFSLPLVKDEGEFLVGSCFREGEAQYGGVTLYEDLTIWELK